MSQALITGNAASVVGIVDVLSRSINTVRELRDQWKDANLNCLNLGVQLNALKAALTKIGNWTESEMAESHHQLTMDLDDSVRCCMILVRRVDALLQDLPRNPDATLKVTAKTKLIFQSSKAMDDLQNMIQRQTSALSLLMTACNFETLSEQRKYLEGSTIRKTFERVERDSASLIALLDSSSLRSQRTDWTDHGSKLSVIFNFDGEVLLSKTYERARRASLKVAVQRGRASLNEKTVTGISKASPAQASTLPESEFNLLLLGPTCSGKSRLLNQMRISYGGAFSQQERMELKFTIIGRRKFRTEGLHLRTEGFHLRVIDEDKTYTPVLPRMNGSEHLSIVAFSIALSEYDIASAKDPTRSQLHESLDAFESIANSRDLAHTLFALVFIEKHIFTSKVASGHCPISKYFPEYDGNSTDPTATMEFFVQKFRDVIQWPSLRVGTTLFERYGTAVKPESVAHTTQLLQCMIFQHIATTPALGRLYFSLD